VLDRERANASERLLGKALARGLQGPEENTRLKLELLEAEAQRHREAFPERTR
jgi:hypothetical protein